MAVSLNTLLKTVVDNKATGLHIRGNSNVFVRMEGKIRAIENCFLTNDEVKNIASAIMTEKDKKLLERNLSVDFALDAKEHGRFRFNIYRQSGKMCMAVRHIPLQIPSFEELSLPGETLKKMSESRRGIILVTGMTGSGKSSTLASMINEINKTRACHILTVEDPIEFIHMEQKAIVSQLSLGTDTLTYTSALRYAMRQDPDVIMLGELRDVEVIRAAILAAEMGHLVLSTLHTIDAVQTISRVIEAYPAEQQGQIRFQLSDLIRGIICQRLLPKVGGGMIPALEIMLPTGQIKSSIEDNKLYEINRAMLNGEYYGMCTFDKSLARLYSQGKITLDDALAYSTSPETIKLLVKGAEVDGFKL